jgi:hypothetical protein
MTGERIKQLLFGWGIEPSTKLHYETAVVTLDFAKDTKITSIIKQVGGKWSRTLSSWYVPKSKQLLEKLVKEIAKSKHEDIESAELREMERKLQLKDYSVNTIKSYKNAFSLFSIIIFQNQ